MAIDFGKAKERLGGMAVIAADKAKVVGEKAADVAMEGARIASEKAVEKRNEFLRNHYKPVFLDEFKSGFDRPKLIVIMDEDGRKGIEVCEGAIGWMGKEKDLEVLFSLRRSCS